MKRLFQAKVLVISLSLALTFSLGIADLAKAEWLENSGYAGQVIQSSFVIPWLGNYYSRGTLILDIKEPGKTANVIFPVPTKGDKGILVNKIKFRFAGTNENAVITKVDVYNGEKKIFTIEGPWSNTGGGNAFKTVTLTLPAAVGFSNGLGLDFTLQNNNSTGGAIYRFATVGANFQ